LKVQIECINLTLLKLYVIETLIPKCWYDSVTIVV
jgi:hypothetical protein